MKFCALKIQLWKQIRHQACSHLVPNFIMNLLKLLHTKYKALSIVTGVVRSKGIVPITPVNRIAWLHPQKKKIRTPIFIENNIYVNNYKV